jgi:mediator of RNA polymerase II transcription subunit 17
MSANPSPFSIRPIKAPGDRKPKSLAEFIARVNATHPGGFRALNQADVKKQIEENKKKQHGDADSPDVHMDDGAGSEEEADAEAGKDLGAAKMEMLRNISYDTCRPSTEVFSYSD